MTHYNTLRDFEKTITSRFNTSNFERNLNENSISKIKLLNNSS